MSGKLARELKQTKPFGTLEEEVFVNVLKTAAVLEGGVAVVLKTSGLSPTQYNTLRILRGAGEGGLPCHEISERMIKRDPDLTRLLDRMEKAGLVERHRSNEDRRMVFTRITERGREFMATLAPASRQVAQKALGHLGEKKLRALIELLEEAREGT